MPGFNGISQVLTAINAGQTDDFIWIKSPINGGSSYWTSQWFQSGTPGAGVAPAGTPGTQYAGDAGSISFTNVSPSTRVGLSFGAFTNTATTILLADRLVGVGALSLASATSVTVSSAALTRYTTGVGVQAWLEVSTAGTTTAVVVNLSSYTNQAGTTGQVGPSITFPTVTPTIGAMMQLPLQAGDSGVRAVSTITVSTAGTAIVASLLLMKPIVYLSVPQTAIYNERDLMLQLPAMPVLPDGSTLFIMNQGVASGPYNGVFRTVWG